MTAFSSTNCIDPQQLARYAAGQLSGREAECCEVHLESCQQCAAALVECFESADAVPSAFGELESRAIEVTTAGGTDKGVGLGLWRRMQVKGAQIKKASDSYPQGDAQKESTGTDVHEESTSKVTTLDHRSLDATPPVDLSAHLRAKSQPANDAPTILVGRYRLDQLLGTGGSGCVYLAFDQRLKRRVAVKLPHPGIIESPTHIELLLAEAQTVASLDHPGIAPIYDVGSAGGQRLFLVTKLIDGTNLSERLSRGPIDDRDVVRWTIEIAEALHYAHEQGVIHRDIKPQNILLEESGRVFLTDFGLAWRTSEADQKHPRAGTPAYMSPEQFGTIDAPIDRRTDIYSLGRILLELLGPSAPHPLVSIGQRATENEPNARYQTAAELATELRSYVEAMGWSADTVATQVANHARSAIESSNALSADGTTSTPNSAHGRRTNGTSAAGSHNRFRSRVSIAACMLLAAVGVAAWMQWTAGQKRAFAMDALLRATPAALPGCVTAVRACGPSMQAELMALSTSNDPKTQLRAKLALLVNQPRYVSEVMQTMISADVELAEALSKVLEPHAGLIADDVWAIAMEPSNKPCSRLNAAMFLANACSDDSRWADTEFQAQIALCMVHDDLHSMGVRSRAFDKVRSQVIRGIRYAARDFKDRVIGLERLLIYDVWNALVRDDIPGTVDLLVDCPPTMFEKVADRLKPDRLTLECLRAKLSDTHPGEINGAYSRHFAAGMALLRFGLVDDFLQLWDHAPSLERPDMVITNLGYGPISKPAVYGMMKERGMFNPLNEPPTQWCERLFDARLARRRSLLRGVVRPSTSSKLSDDDTHELIEQLKRLAACELDAGMRATAEFALRESGQTNLANTIQYQPPPVDLNGRSSWSVNSVDQIMVHIYDAPNVHHAFAIGQCEVDRSLYEQFLCETGYEWNAPDGTQVVPEDLSHHPQGHVSWYDCAAFCNWLSRREGRAECYQCSAQGEFAEGMRLKANFAALDGYRLPLSTEWREASAAGATTKFVCGSNPNILRRFAWMQPASLGKPARVGSSAPNALGLFDVYGNVREWTLDSSLSDRCYWVLKDCQPCEHRGGDFQSTELEELELDHVQSDSPCTRRATVGFRVARSLVP